METHYSRRSGSGEIHYMITKINPWGNIFDVCIWSSPGWWMVLASIFPKPAWNFLSDRTAQSICPQPPQLGGAGWRRGYSTTWKSRFLHVQDVENSLRCASASLSRQNPMLSSKNSITYQHSKHIFLPRTYWHDMIDGQWRVAIHQACTSLYCCGEQAHW